MSFHNFRRYLAVGVLAGLLGLSGCNLVESLSGSSTATPSGPVITNHTPLVLPSIDITPFLQAGCTVDSSLLRCPAQGAFAASGCTVFFKDTSGLGGLGGQLIMCRQQNNQRDIPASDYFYNDGCAMPMYVRYMLWRDGKLQALRGPSDLKAAFAPVDSPLEALSYAIASTGYDPKYGVKFESSYRYTAKAIEDTFVKEEGNGYRVRLYYSRVCGCGPHPEYAADVLVGRDGSLNVEKLGEMFANPKYDGMCVD